jgi:hypothetical protein
MVTILGTPDRQFYAVRRKETAMDDIESEPHKPTVRYGWLGAAAALALVAFVPVAQADDDDWKKWRRHHHHHHHHYKYYKPPKPRVYYYAPPVYYAPPPPVYYAPPPAYYAPVQPGVSLGINVPLR